MRALHVAVAQIHSKACDVDGNLGRLKRQVQSAAAAGVEVILFAETALHAYDFSRDNLAKAEPLDGPLGREVSRLAGEFKVSILTGFLQRDAGRIYNSHLVARPDGTLDVQAKFALTAAEIAAGIAAGPRKRKVFEFNGVRTAILICADTGIDGISAELRGDRVDFCFIPTAGGGTPQQMIHEAELDTDAGREAYTNDRKCVFEPAAIAEKRAMHCGFASANALGSDGHGVCHRGHCMILDRHFVVRAQIPGTNVYEHQHDQMAHALLSFPNL